MPGEQQQFLVWGSGAIGGTVGAYLARAGHAVTFVDLVEEHIERICTPPGLRITVRTATAAAAHSERRELLLEYAC